MTHINEIEGIGAVQGKKLEAAGIQSVEALLQEAATPKGRKELEAKTGIGHHQLLRYLHAKLVEVNDSHQHVNVVPSAEHVKHWIEEAKALPRVVQY
jgi:Domain of unknown function (DUF4332)